METTPDRPWYRQFYPWLLITLPACAVVGGFLTLYLAMSHPDKLVKENCHRDGAITVCDEAGPRSP